MFSSGKSFKKTIEDQGEKQAKALESLELFNKINKLKQVKDLFPHKHLNDLMKDRLKEIIKLQSSFKTSNSNYLSKKQGRNFINSSLPAMFLGDIDQISISINDPHEEQSIF